MFPFEGLPLGSAEPTAKTCLKVDSRGWPVGGQLASSQGKSSPRPVAPLILWGTVVTSRRLEPCLDFPGRGGHGEVRSLGAFPSAKPAGIFLGIEVEG